MAVLILLIAIAFVGAALVVAGAYVMFGAGVALTMSGGCLIAAAFILRAGLKPDA